MRHFQLCLIIGAVMALSQSAKAQAPFFFGGASAFTPEISVVNSGALLDMQATVSADRKYVTLTARPQISTLEALRSFNFQQGTTGLGMAGDEPKNAAGANGAGASGATAGSNKHDATSGAVQTSPSAILAHARSTASVLHKQGMSKISPLKE